MITLALNASASCGRCRLWESQAQFERRFGQAYPDTDDAPFGEVKGCTLRTYEKGGIACYAYFLSDKCVCECFSRTDGELSDVDLNVFLDADAFGKPWIPLGLSKGVRSWRKSDGSASAMDFEEHKPEFVAITVPRFNEISESDEAAQAQERKDNLSFLSDSPAPTPTPDTPAFQESAARSQQEQASTPPLSPLKPTPPPAAFLADVGYSQKAALSKYPELGIKGSPLNRRFLARYEEWNARGDQRLSSSDWPEKLAADCVDNPSSEEAARKKQGETNQIASVLGPMPTLPPLHTPKPPYPYQARAANLQGTGSVRVTFDGSGNVASAVIGESCGSGILDSNAISWAKTNWSGPPNSSATIPITYRLNQ